MSDKTDNELIAEFMGVKETKSSFDSYGHNSPCWYTTNGLHRSSTFTVPDKSFSEFVNESRYHISWDWLMPVVEKISKHIYESYKDNNGYKDVIVDDRAFMRTFGMIDNNGNWMVRINRMTLHQEDTLIKATYNAALEFIKFIKQQ